MGNDGTPGGQLLTWFAMIVLAVIAFKVAMLLLSTLLGLAMFVLFNVLPIVIAVWLLMKVWRIFFPRHDDFGHA